MPNHSSATERLSSTGTTPQTNQGPRRRRAPAGKKRIGAKWRLPNINTHPFAFGRYYLVNIAIFSALSAITVYATHRFETTSWQWIICLVPLFLSRFRYIIASSLILFASIIYVFGLKTSAGYLVLLPLAVYIGHLSAVLIHNAVHYNFKPRWLNSVVGELCAAQQLSAGFPVFREVHIAHHGHPDDLENDPHPPQGQGFFEYVDASRSLILSWINRTYAKKWGDDAAAKKRLATQNMLLLVSRFAKTFFWFALLGPKAFVLLFLPSYVSNVFLFAAFNYFSHREYADGTTEILNLKDNLYYRFCNKTLFGIMYHKNHHLKPRLFNPMHLDTLTHPVATTEHTAGDGNG